MNAARRGGGSCLLAGTLLAVSGAVFAQDCSAPEIGAVAGADQSRWYEYGAQGARLVKEDGRLWRTGIRAALSCATLEWSFDWLHNAGRRDYEGFTNTRVPVRTVTHIDADELSLAVLHPFTAGATAGLRLGLSDIDRTIESTGLAVGYPERFRYWSAAVGGRYTWALGEGLGAAVHGWVGGGPAGRLRVDLPGADPAELRLGSSRLLEMGIRIGSGSPRSRSGGWSWAAGLTFRDETMRAGEPQVLRVGSVPVGVAAQPRTTQRTLALFAIASFAF